MFQSIQDKYKKEVIPKRKEHFGVDNVLAVPKIEKVVLNARVKQGGNINEETVMSTLGRITGQKPVTTKARVSISNFKIRQGMVVGVMVTLRGQRAYDFLDKLVNVALPRVRDFSGITTSSLDSAGNLTIGLPEHIVFPEVADDDVAHVHGLQITIKTTAKNSKDAHTLLMALGFPFKSSNT